MAERFEIVFLGTGAPLQSPDRCGNSQVIIAGDTHVMIDCGWGSSRRVIPSGVLPKDVGVLVLSHMHSDHITDIPDFLFQRWTNGADRPLQVYGPEGTAETMAGFMQAMRLDIGYRKAHHGDKLIAAGAEVVVHEIPVTGEPNAFFEAGGLVLESFE
ncbi:MAG: MBL fold metallo-hydrolase, partial [Dehalococcoidia bacterium]